jgi:alkylation response protein AidB-like acyl-CoA dehydrogenase
MVAEGASTLWLVPSRVSGLQVTAPFDGLGLRGNYSSPIIAEGVMVEKAAMLGPDGGGFEVMMNIVLLYFQFMSAGCCVGIMEAATTKAAAHVI